MIPNHKKSAGLTNEQIDELRTLIEELDLVPLSFYPPELRPIALDYYQCVFNDETPFDEPITNIALSVHLSKRKHIKPQITDNDIDLFLCVPTL